MKIWYSQTLDNQSSMIELKGNRIRIGRGPQNDLILNHVWIAQQAAVIEKIGNSWELTALGFNDIKVGDKGLSNGQKVMLDATSEIVIRPYTLTLDLPRVVSDSDRELHQKLDREISALLQKVHVEILNRMGADLKSIKPDKLTSEQVLGLEQLIELLSQDLGLAQKSNLALVSHLAGYATKSFLLEKINPHDTSKETILLTNATWSRMVTSVPDREQELVATCSYLMQLMQLGEKLSLQDKIQTIEKFFFDHWRKTTDSIHKDFRLYLANRYLKRQLKDILFGYGPLEDLLRLPTISEIMVVDKENIYVEESGKLQKSGRQFISDEVTISIIERIVAKVGRRIDKSEPMVDARLSDGSRVNAVIPPLAVSGPCLTIRKFPLKRLKIDDLINKGALTQTACNFLRAAVLHCRSILVSGGTGTGKTTFLNCLSDFIPDNERIITVEDVAELQLNKEHVVSLETKKKSSENTGEVTIRDLVRNSLRMRPNRIIVGECRGPEALDMLQAMNTGHGGSMTTIHANTAEDVIMRLEVLVQMAAQLPVSSIYRQIGSAIDVIVQMERMRNGRRCVSQISEVVGCDPITGKVELRDLFLLDSETLEATLVPTGHLPSFMGDLIELGFLDLENFYEGSVT
jgi:Flp pilus assembly CpaF family ATPase